MADLSFEIILLYILNMNCDVYVWPLSQIQQKNSDEEVSCMFYYDHFYPTIKREKKKKKVEKRREKESWPEWSNFKRNLVRKGIK